MASATSYDPETPAERPEPRRRHYEGQHRQGSPVAPTAGASGDGGARPRAETWDGGGEEEESFKKKPKIYNLLFNFELLSINQHKDI